MRTLFIVMAVLALATGCSSDKKSAPASSVDGLVAKLKKAGLAPGELATFDGAKLGSSKCRRGDVSGIEMTVCEYDDASRAKKYEEAGLDVVGDAPSGSSLAEGKLLLVVADRKKVDTDGKKINSITRAFRGR